MKPAPTTVEILGIPLHAGPAGEAVAELLATCLAAGERRSRCVSATGAHGLVTARRDRGFGEILRTFHRNLPDGMPAVWIGRLKGAARMERCYGPDFFAEVLARSAGRPVRHFFCGGAEGVAEALRAACARRFGNTGVVGCYSPPFREMSDAELDALGAQIDAAGADIVWVGLGTPKQERFAARLAPRVRAHYLVTVGAAFDFVAGRVRQAPRWLQRAGLEWAFRLCMEPRRLLRRYGVVVPLFLYYNFTEWVARRAPGRGKA